mmetsp:Transcript_19455/g.45315  ORF Transcript_19455/g.45315 Transcript_19455/m.45315 type:complete len:227 (+) Transcript_19455:105-785(+)|eukprot:CAMPEP_0197182980 /NCGR_PEP_ID=MMETSP1423-20130617/7195_1 /TAXON_ID=476441 /ORGANISM="Pseudo-nitzschia heimii, Strain UNC1101" /LENGTH=226 /DNA_ID=CAMNT_0042633499 /DNA_START=143 /DNA_END=823 /DNA_ORIENTATION=-
MGSVFGKESVLEPTFKTILERPATALTNYQIREYATRFVAEVEYAGGNDNTGKPFRALAKYIGVFGEAQNEGAEPMAMTAPVAMERKGTPMAMTAPVAMEKNASSDGGKIMKFFLPAEYDEMKKIPKPTNPDVKITEIPPQVGVVHRYSGSLTEKLHDEKAKALSAQLREDGIDRMTEEHVMQHYQFWGFNPPFTLPMFRRNEVWLELTPEEVQILKKKFKVEEMN